MKQFRKMNIFKFATILLLCFVLNLISHGSLLLGVFNTILLGSTLFSLQSFSGKKFLSIQFSLIILLGAMPLFTHFYKDIFTVFFAIGTVLLLFIYSKIKFKFIAGLIILFYISVAALYIGEIIRFPLSYQDSRLLFSDNWTNLAISEIQKEALYIPYRIRLLIFNNSAYIYVILSKLTDLFMIKNISNILLLANLYPLVVGLIAFLKSPDERKTLITLSIFIISFLAVLSRAIDVFSTFLILSPFLIYLILLGLGSLNKRLYFVLVVLSLLLAYNPLK